MIKIKSMLLVIIFSVIIIANSILTVYAADGVSLLILGDSISTGYGLPYAGTVNCDSYGNLLCQKLGIADENFYNGAVNGYTSSDLLGLLSQVSDRIQKADVIVFSIGGNDVLSSMITDFIIGSGVDVNLGLYGVIDMFTSENADLTDIESSAETYFSEARVKGYETRAEGYRTNYTAIAKALREYNPDALIIAQTLYNPVDNISTLPVISDFAANILQMINDITVDISAQYDIAVADIALAFAGNGSSLTNILDGDIHPNADGHMKIFETVDAIVASVELPVKKTETEITPESETTFEITEVTDDAQQTGEETHHVSEETEAISVPSQQNNTGSIIAAVVIAIAVILIVVLTVVVAKNKKPVKKKK